MDLHLTYDAHPGNKMKDLKRIKGEFYCLLKKMNLKLNGKNFTVFESVSCGNTDDPNQSFLLLFSGLTC